MRIFNDIRFDNLRGDLFGGMTAAIVALPMALAFGVASGAGPEAGLYGAVLVGLFAALFGGTPTLMSEPTGPMTVVMTAIIASLVAAHPEQGMAMAFTTVMLAGLFQILFSVMKLGRFVTLMPYTVISGFMSGIGLILVILQTPVLLGHPTPSGGVLGSLQGIPELLTQIRPQELLLAAVTLGLLFFTPARFRRIVPPQLIALIVGTLISIWLLSGEEIRRIGEIDTGLPSLQLPYFDPALWKIILIDALVLAMLGSIDALLSSMIADSLTRQEHNSDKELMGQGMGNLVSGLFGGLPGAGATMGTVVNIQSGGRSALAGLIRASILIVVVLWAAGLTAHIPLAVLAAIAVKVGIDIIDWGFLRRAHKVSLRGAFIMYGVIGLTVLVDLIVAVGIGLFVANILTIRRLADLQEESVMVCRTGGEAAAVSNLIESERELLQRGDGKIGLLCLSGPLIFAAAQTLTRQAPSLQDAKALVVDFSEVKHLGVTTALALETILRDGRRNDAQISFVGLHGQPERRLEKMGVLELVSAELRVDQRSVALQGAYESLSLS